MKDGPGLCLPYKNKANIEAKYSLKCYNFFMNNGKQRNTNNIFLLHNFTIFKVSSLSFSSSSLEETLEMQNGARPFKLKSGTKIVQRERIIYMLFH